MSKNRIMGDNKAQLKDARGDVIERFQEVAYYAGAGTSLGVGTVVGFTMKSVWILARANRDAAVASRTDPTALASAWSKKTPSLFEFVERCVFFTAPDRAVMTSRKDDEFESLVMGGV